MSMTTRASSAVIHGSRLSVEQGDVLEFVEFVNDGLVFWIEVRTKAHKITICATLSLQFLHK